MYFPLGENLTKATGGFSLSERESEKKGQKQDPYALASSNPDFYPHPSGEQNWVQS